MTALITDDHPLFRKALKDFIKSFNIFTEIFEAENGEQTLALSSGKKLDLFILDFKMPDMDGYELTKILLAKDSSSKIIIITMYSDSVLIENLYKAGVKGFLVKNSEMEQIECAIKLVLNGEVYLGVPRKHNGTFPKINFTNHDRELVRLISKGQSSHEIAAENGLSVHTVETYRTRLLKKTDSKNAAELVGYFYRNGLL